MTLPKNSVDFHQSQGTSYFSMRLRHYQNKKEKKILKIQILWLQGEKEILNTIFLMYT